MQYTFFLHKVYLLQFQIVSKLIQCKDKKILINFLVLLCVEN